MKRDSIIVTIKGIGKLDVDRGKTLKSLLEELEIPNIKKATVVGALYNNRIVGLEYPVRRNCTLDFLTLKDENGMEIYRRSLVLLFHTAFQEIYGGELQLKIEHSLNRGYYFSVVGREGMTDEEIKKIEEKMRELVDKRIPFIKQEFEIEDALDIFENKGMWDRYWLLRYQDTTKIILYSLKNFITVAQGPMVPDTGYLKIFSLKSRHPGIILNFPLPQHPLELPESIKQDKLFQIYSEHREWAKILDIDCAGKLNRAIIKGNIDEIIWVSEGLHEKKIAQIADIITRNVGKKRIILLAGPSSSGKTTFAKRLTIQLLANGIRPEVISLDNYYLPRDKIPRDKEGKLDLECLEALDIELINKHLKMLLEGKTVEVPKYDFKTGKIKDDTRKIKIDKNQIVIIEGIHGMNEKLTKNISKDEKFKIYISALTQLNLDYVNRIPTSTVRLIRRIVRDNQFRNYSARQTIKQWPSVRAGEDKHIFPFQEEADVMFNSSLVYELAVLRGFIEPLLKDIEDSEEEYIEAKKLLHLLSNFVYISPDHVPLTSILREFIGGSGFRY